MGGPDNFLGNSTTVSFSQALQPRVPALVHVFSDSDMNGIWYVKVQNVSSARVDFLLTETDQTQANMTMTGHGLIGGALALNYSVSPGLGFYDAEACALGTQNQTVAYVQVPSGLGGGQLGLDWNGSAVTLVGSGLGNRTFTVSVELYHSYSFLIPGSVSTLVSRNVPVARSEGAALSDRNASAILGIRSDIPLRVGRYVLQAIFHGDNWASLAETRVLLTGGPNWIWLAQCAPSQVYTNDFTDTIRLGSNPATWPRVVYFLYRTGGVEGFAVSEVGLNFSEVEFIGAPWAAHLNGYSVSVAALAGDSAYGITNQTVYLIQSGLPSSFSYSVALGNQTFFQGNVGSIKPFTYNPVFLNVSRLSVSYVSSAGAVEGVDIRVADAGGNLTTTSTGKDGTVTLYLPPGSYSVVATDGNITSRQDIVLTAGESSQLEFGVSSASTQTQQAVLWLSALAGLGILLNLIVAVRKRRKGLRIRTKDSLMSRPQQLASGKPRQPAQ